MIAALARADALCSVSALRGLAKVSYIPIQDNLGNKIEESLSQMEKLGTLKRERVLTSAQGAWISALPLTAVHACLQPTVRVGIVHEFSG
jgi:hypothetical protein